MKPLKWKWEISTIRQQNIWLLRYRPQSKQNAKKGVYTVKVEMVKSSDSTRNKVVQFFLNHIQQIRGICSMNKFISI